MTTPRMPAQPRGTCRSTAAVPPPASGARPHQQVAGEEHPHEPQHDHGDEGGSRTPRRPCRRVTSPPNASPMIERACRPISRNTALSSRNAMLRQFSRSAIRDCAVCRIGDLCPSSSPAHDDAEHAGGVDLLGGDVRRERGQEAERGVDAPDRSRACATKPITMKNTSPTRTPPPAATRKSRPDDAPGHGRRGRRDRGVQRDQGGGVVEQRLALEDGDDAARQPDPAADRGRRHGVRRRDDGADGEGRRTSRGRAGARARAPRRRRW